MAKRWRRSKKQQSSKPAIDANEVNEVEVDPLSNAVYGRYSGQLLNPDDPFYPAPDNRTDISDGSGDARA